MLPRILIAGIGNIFMGDDAFGCAVAQRLMQKDWPANVKVVDYGIRGLDLAYALMDGFETAVLIDATPQGQPPGTVYLIELNPEETSAASACLDAHSMHPLNVLRMVHTLGGTTTKILLIGCEPAEVGDELEGKMELSKPVQAAVETACRRIEVLVNEQFNSSFQLPGTTIATSVLSKIAGAERL